MSSRHWIGALLGATVLCGAAFAQTVTLKPDHPERYIVQKGDTLWDIAGRFLSEPWRWTEIWQANPQIKNPDLIYPGDEVMLTYVGGRPFVTVRRGGPRPTVKLSPTVRVEAVDTAIPTIPIDAIRQFLKRPLVVGKNTLADAPYIVSVGKEALLARPGEKIFARGVAGDATRFTVYRAGQEYVDPETGEVLGYEAIHDGDAILDRAGDPATLVLTGMTREVLAGDRLLPVVEEEMERNFLPRPPSGDVVGQIIAVVDGVTQIGQHQIVVLNRGAQHGIDTGNVMAVYQSGEVIEDAFARDPNSARPWYQSRREVDIELDPEKQGGAEGLSNAAHDLVFDVQERFGALLEHLHLREHDYRTVKLPDARAGTVMVFRRFDRISYALVMDASRAMHVNDTVRSP